MASFRFSPHILRDMKSYSLEKFLADLSAGITVGVVALPLAMAFAIASGLKPEAGIFTAIIAGAIISGLGGSRVQIGGPAGAFIVIVYGIVAKYGVDGLILSTLMAGVLLFVMGMFRLGSLVRLVPVAIVTGFTNGIAVLIALSQIKDVLGLKIEHLPAGFFAQSASLIEHLPTADITTIGITLLSLAIVFGWRLIADISKIKLFERIPGSIIALVVGTLLTAVLQLPIETIGTRFGGIPDALPAPVFPHITWELIQSLLPPALTIALLGAIESLLCARVADGLIDDRHDPNQELMAQGMANFIAPLFGGYAATGTIARTVTNIKAGAVSPIAGIIHAITLLMIVMIAAPLAQDIPLATLGAILLYVAWHMGEWHEFARMKHFTHKYRIVLMATFILTVVMDLTVAVEVGLFLSCLFFITRIASLTRLEPVPEVEAQGHAKLGGDIEAYRISGSLFFGSAHLLENLAAPDKTARVIVIGMRDLLNMDTSGLEALEMLHQSLKKRGGTLLLARVGEQPLSLMQRSGFLDQIGRDYVHDTMPHALEHAARLVAV